MRNVFLSFLGTNDYLPCTYYRDEDNFESRNVRFVQEATIRLCCGDWGEKDRILIFTTADAYRKNWLDDGHVGHKTGEILERQGLKKCLADANLKCPVIRIEIPEGKSEAEIWAIFSIVFRALEQDDEVIFDITHAFRSIPMLAIVILNYAKVMKNVALTGIYYGAFEVLGSQYDAKNIPVDQRQVPIYDLTAFDQLLDWCAAVDRFAAAGDAALINTLARTGLKKILTETQGKNRNAAAIRDVGRNLETFCQILATCREDEISPIAEKLKSKMEECENTHVIPPFQPLFGMLREGVEGFTGDRISDGIAAANWCINHNLIQQGATILREVVINYLVTRNKQDVNNHQERELAAFGINVAFREMHGGQSTNSEEDRSKGAEAYVEICSQEPELVNIWGPLSKLRNDLNHAGHVKDPKQASGFSKQLPILIQMLQNAIEDRSTLQQ